MRGIVFLNVALGTRKSAQVALGSGHALPAVI